jgi:glycosyltransferase involved in cell wall biosynthesis
VGRLICLAYGRPRPATVAFASNAARPFPAPKPMTATGRRILVVTPYLPDPPEWGSAIRVRELVRELSTRHRVTLLSFTMPWQAENARKVREICESVHTVPAPWPDGSNRAGRLRSLASRTPYAVSRLASAPMQRALDDLLAEGDYDLVQVESSLMSTLDLSRAPATILDTHNIEYELLRRTVSVERAWPRKVFNLVESLKVRRTEVGAWRRHDGCAVTSERERLELMAAVPDKPVVTVPNGVDVGHWEPQASALTSGIVFTGLMSYRPNIDAVTYFVREILPLIHRVRPAETFTMVGWGLNDEVRALLGPRVIATSRVPDVRPYLASAAVVVAPIRIGSGTRLKVLEALAMARPLVSTSLACEGLDLVSGSHLIVADNPSRFADAVIQVLENTPIGERLGAAGRKVMESRYSWTAATERLEELHDRVLTAKGAVHGRPAGEGARISALAL